MYYTKNTPQIAIRRIAATWLLAFSTWPPAVLYYRWDKFGAEDPNCILLPTLKFVWPADLILLLSPIIVMIILYVKTTRKLKMLIHPGHNREGVNIEASIVGASITMSDTLDGEVATVSGHILHDESQQVQEPQKVTLA